MEILFLIGRIIFGGYFLMNAINGHLRQHRAYTGYAASRGVPMPGFAVAFSGLLIFAGGLGILLGVYVPWAVLALALFLVPVNVMMHAYWKISDPNARMVDYVNFWKNLALLGAALMFLAIPTPWPFSL